MKTILVTGSAGFIGRHLCLALHRTADTRVLPFDLPGTREEMREMVRQADFVYHLAGVNRPRDEAEFQSGNVDLTRELCDALRGAGRSAPLVLSSSIQAEQDNPYGRSKRAAEEEVRRYRRESGARVFILRLPNVFGKWSRPDYNSVVATFCHHLARGRPVQINRRDSVIRLAYIDDVVRRLKGLCEETDQDAERTEYGVDPVFSITVGELHDRLVAFRDQRKTARLPDLSDPFTRYLYATFLSFCPPDGLAYDPGLKNDDRGWLFEMIQSPGAGQIFVSRTKPGVTRGHHYHDTKAERFCVVKGTGTIRLRPVGGADIVTYTVSDRDVRVVDIPPGFTHSIENQGADDMITIFWASEVFDSRRPDTYAERVEP
jgi:UDP-2-acetamido-2,6-beta-L-arabino-hexul-4-ose reductase